MDPLCDYKYVADRFLDDGNLPFYERTDLDDRKPAECLICREAEQGNMTKYAQKARKEAHAIANTVADEKAENGNKTMDYIDYYMFFYRVEYTRVFEGLFEKYRDDYYDSLMEKEWDLKYICSYHRDSIRFHAMPRCPKCKCTYDDIVPDPCPECPIREACKAICK